ncbi:MAG: A/G-specific adenine glycosylase [Candidatus Carbobacillus altaicus]|uniref:Adenine DNA glycosylase n=1 Tax=Candidatus Carbonibacillus altaicus TaxID=2163959 RepID=A0A2R6Y0E0_9BACL|nr:A/G-specific adenine glycosylase [Candidatus Carbobacillus altaicus]PTQ56135.1 MAG: A/G-specific adenine glycosylase [Candidatus Carbobacillus altaicus]
MSADTKNCPSNSLIATFSSPLSHSLTPVQKAHAPEEPTHQKWSQALLKWYDQNRRDLPWRNTRDPYAILVSELMLQQTQVTTVIPYYLRWLELFPSFHALARASLEDVLKTWEGLGYYRRARYLYETANIVSERYGGELPDDAEILKRLPGIGDYTLGALLSIAFGRREPAVDGNVRRVASRFWALSDDLGKGRALRNLKETIRAAMPEDRPGDFTQALMELGGTVCTPSAPRCNMCPLNVYCIAYQTDRVAEFPAVKEAPKKKTERRRMWIIEWDGKLFLQKRTEKLLEGMWEFPHERLEEKHLVQNTVEHLVRTDQEGVQVFRERTLSDGNVLKKDRYGVPMQLFQNVFPASSAAIQVKHVRRIGFVKHVFTHLIWDIEVFAVALDMQGAIEQSFEKNWFTEETLSRLPLAVPIQKAWKLWKRKCKNS